MSKLETPLTEAYWATIGGTLIKEFFLVRRSSSAEARRADAVILPNGAHRKAHWREPIYIEGQDVIVVQTKASRLGMNLMGQAVFSAELMRKLNPRSVRSIALCTQDDSALHPLLDAYPNVDIVIMAPPDAAMPGTETSDN
jgi:hypothetical protein